MPRPTMRARFLTLPRYLQRGLLVFFALCGVVTLLDFGLEKHGAHWWNFFAFHSLYGFIACVTLVLVATWLRKPLMRAQDYYDAAESTDRSNDPTDPADSRLPPTSAARKPTRAKPRR